MNRISFDVRYDPDLVFPTNTRLSDKFPNDAGQGVLNLMFPERAFCGEFANLAHCAVIVDDCLIQFSEDADMYVLDIPSNTVSTYQITGNHIPSDLLNWVKRTGVTAVKMMKAIESSQTAMNELQLFTMLLCYHTARGIVSQKDYNAALEMVKNQYRRQNVKLTNRCWYFDGSRTTWGNVALSYFKEYFRGFINYMS